MTEETDDPAARLALALMRELDGKLNRAGLESLGIDLQANKVLYGMGAFPVIRLGLSDPAVLRDTIHRVMNNAGLPAPEQNYQGLAYWRISGEPSSKAPVAFYAAVLDDHLALGLFPPAAESELLPAFLGVERPAETDVAARLARLNHDHGYTPYSSGILDLHRLADQFLDPQSTLARVIAQSGHDEMENWSAQCVAEIHQIIDNAPLMTVGTKAFDEHTIAIQYRVENPETLAGQLAALVSKIPAVEENSTRIMEFAFGMRVGAVRDFLREKAAAVVAAPYQCERLQQLNDWAAQVLARLDQPVPPFVNNFLGIRASLDQIEFDLQTLPTKARGLLALHVESPEMFVGMAQMLLPDLSKLNLARGEPPARIPDSVLPIPGMVAYAAMSRDAIGLSVGEGEQDALTAYIERKPGPEGVFFSASYDAAAYARYSRKMADEAMAGMPEEHHDDLVHFAQKTQDMLTAILDRNDVSMRFGPDGLVADSQMTFK
jgi:hypothetical protein